jgi:biopolymer transport protein ExbD
MKATLKATLFTLAIVCSCTACAEPTAVTVTSTGYLVAGKQVTTTEQLLQELKASGNPEVTVSLSPGASMEKFGALVTVLQKSGKKVGFISSPAQHE